MNLSQFKIDNKGPFSKLVTNLGINDLEELDFWIRNLPYGRTTNRGKLIQVIEENRGSCSSKHALFKTIAEENNHSEFKLILCMYKMSNKNTPGIGNEYLDLNINFIPEAHVYIRLNEQVYDMTSAKSSFSRISEDIIEEKEINPPQITSFKVKYHKDFIQRWINENKYPFTLEDIWLVRERCIHNLSENS